MTFALRDRGYEVTASGYRHDLEAVIGDQPVDALVLDCSVWEMSASLFDALRGQVVYADLPVVIISDTPEKVDAGLRSRRARRVLIVPKPFTGSQVAAALERLLPPPGPPAGSAGEE